MGAQYKKIAVAACLIMSAMIGGSVSFGFFMDPVTTDLGFSRSAFSLYFSIVTVVGAITLPIYGNLVRRVGSRKCVIFFGIWTGIAMACFSLCTSLVAFYIVAVFVGLGFFGCSYITAPVIVDTWFKEKNGAVMGAAAATGGVVGVIAGFVFPTIITSMGWQAGYVAMGVMVFVLTVPAGIFLLRSTPQELGLEPYGASAAVRSEVKEDVACEQGMTCAEAMKSPKLWVSIIAWLMFTITVSVTQHLSAYFTSVGFSAGTAGVFMSIISAALIVTSFLAGVVSDKLGLFKTIVICSVLYVLSFVVLPAAGMGIVLICVALFGMSVGNTYTSVFAPMVTSATFGTKEYAAIWGVVSMVCVLGQAIGTPLWGLSFDLTGGYQFGMIVAAVLNAVGMVCVMAVLKVRSTRAAQASKTAEAVQ